MLQLEAAGVTASIDPARGGRLASLRVGGRELLLGAPNADDTSIRWGCFLMAPWPGRLAGARFSWQGRSIHLPRTHGRHAIHGLVWGRPWRVERADQASATLACDLPRAEWPMGGVVRQTFRLRAGSLVQDATIEAGRAMPAALGWHPWFRRRADAGPVRVRVDAPATVELRQMLPTGRIVPVGGRTDLRAGPELGRRRLDHSYVDARSPAVISWPDLELLITFPPDIRNVVVYTPPEVFCVEPQTAWPDAFHDRPADGVPGRGWASLPAGGVLGSSISFDWGSAPERADDAAADSYPRRP